MWKYVLLFIQISLNSITVLQMDMFSWFFQSDFSILHIPVNSPCMWFLSFDVSIFIFLWICLYFRVTCNNFTIMLICQHFYSVSMFVTASSSFDRITDLHSLSKYLREQDEKEYIKSALSKSWSSPTVLLITLIYVLCY